MQKHWLIKNNNPSIIIFALGWAADHHAVEHIQPQGYDILCLYDYRTTESLTHSDILKKYDKRYLFAWSFGVWAAEQIFQNTKFTKAVALCGTPYPVNDRYGIPEKIMSVTLRGIMAMGTERFNKRAYGESCERLAQFPETRTMEEKYNELQTLARMSLQPYAPTIEWDKAIIATRDVIFPKQNVENYWQDKGIEMDIPHYPFEKSTIVTENL